MVKKKWSIFFLIAGRVQVDDSKSWILGKEFTYGVVFGEEYRAGNFFCFSKSYRDPKVVIFGGEHDEHVLGSARQSSVHAHRRLVNELILLFVSLLDGPSTN